MDAAELLSHPVSERLSLIQLAREQGISPPSTWRWATRGCRGLRLPTLLLGHKRLTTRTAFVWWVSRLTARAAGDEDVSQNSEDETRLDQIEEVADELLNVSKNE